MFEREDDGCALEILDAQSRIGNHQHGPGRVRAAANLSVWDGRVNLGHAGKDGKGNAGSLLGQNIGKR